MEAAAVLLVLAGDCAMAKLALGLFLELLELLVAFLAWALGA
jgi:hypothetical protein